MWFVADRLARIHYWCSWHTFPESYILLVDTLPSELSNVSPDHSLLEQNKYALRWPTRHGQHFFHLKFPVADGHVHAPQTSNCARWRNEKCKQPPSNTTERFGNLLLAFLVYLNWPLVDLHGSPSSLGSRNHTFSSVPIIHRVAAHKILSRSFCSSIYKTHLWAISRRNHCIYFGWSLPYTCSQLNIMPQQWWRWELKFRSMVHPSFYPVKLLIDWWVHTWKIKLVVFRYHSEMRLRWEYEFDRCRSRMHDESP